MNNLIRWDTFTEWKRKIFLTYDCGPEELLHALKVWAIEQSIWDGRKGIYITATYRPSPEDRDFLIEFKINGEHNRRLVLRSELQGGM
jgi:hypothetical protein